MLIDGRTVRCPLIEEISVQPDSLSIFDLFKDRPFSFLLDSGMSENDLGRYSFIGSDPFLVVRSKGETIDVVCDGVTDSIIGNPFDVLGELLERYAIDRSSSSIPFTGGAVGYLGYDLCHFIECLPSITVDDLGMPDCCIAFYDAVVAIDHVEEKVYIASTGFPCLEESVRRVRAEERLDELKGLIARGGGSNRLDEPFPAIGFGSDGAQQSQLRGNFTREGYIAVVKAAKEYIAGGDIFQVNLSQRFDVDLAVDPYDLYLRLRRINPAPFASYLNFGDVAIVSASPERFLRLEGDLVETRPMKGTRPRGRSEIEDEALADELANSEKDRAENIMIVDLERNDLGRVCEYGTVKVRELCTVEKYATVFQMTSTVKGRLRRGKSRIDLLKAAFPGGSITGAPKVRAMEIIDELEPTRRGVYTGSIGYLGFDGCMDLNIVIRTFVVSGG
ncbi:MAG: anthranilate synthase component I family protein, partial [Chloroflexota bacterium]|nr:anthranilate synthase component I family protein [Chloroflexota bacterium]